MKKAPHKGALSEKPMRLVPVCGRIQHGRSHMPSRLRADSYIGLPSGSKPSGGGIRMPLFTPPSHRMLVPLM